jgi:hypothetical protein
MKTIGVTFLILFLSGYVTFMNLEPSPIYAASDAKQFQVQLQVTSDIAISGCIGTTVMQPPIGLSQYGSVGTTTCGVNTTNSLGYKVDFLASTYQYLKSGTNFFTDKSTTTAPATWANGGTTSDFGFSLFGTDVNTTYWGSGSTCGNPYASTTNLTNGLGSLKYMGFTNFGTGTTTITRNSPTSGFHSFSICLAAEKGSSTNTPSGFYFGTTTVTATTL